MGPNPRNQRRKGSATDHGCSGHRRTDGERSGSTAGQSTSRAASPTHLSERLIKRNKKKNKKKKKKKNKSGRRGRRRPAEGDDTREGTTRGRGRHAEGDDTRKETTRGRRGHAEGDDVFSHSPMRTVQKTSRLWGADLDDGQRGQRGQLMTETEHDMI